MAHRNSSNTNRRDSKLQEKLGSYITQHALSKQGAESTSSLRKQVVADAANKASSSYHLKQPGESLFGLHRSNKVFMAQDQNKGSKQDLLRPQETKENAFYKPFSF